jgi:hypothetical protein
MTADWQSSRSARRLIFVLVWVLSVVYIATLIDRGWAPPDEGFLGQTAERMLGGEVPHRDFDDFYTGGLTALHALTFKFLGVRLIALRAVLFGAVVLWVPALYAVARRFARPLLAGAVTLLAVVWSVPAYPASMPSWYNLFFATAGLLAALRYLETGRYRWLFASGACGGLSILAKIVGVYFLGAVGLLIIYHAFVPAESPGRSPGGPGGGIADAEGSRGGGVWLGIATAGAVIAALFGLIAGSRKTSGSYLQLVMPGATVALLLAAAGWRSARVAWNRVWRPIAALALGAAAILLPFAAWFAGQGALGDLVKGVFVLPVSRLRFASLPPRGEAMLWALPLVGLVVVGLLVRRHRVGTVLAALVAGAGAWLILRGGRTPIYGGIGGEGPVYRPVVDSVATLVPIIAVTFAAIMLSRRGRALTSLAREQAFAAVAVTAFCALIAFPYSNDLYFHYVAPLVCIALLALYSVSGRSVEPRLGAAVIGFYLAFGVIRVAVHPSSRLALDRGGLRVPASDSADASAFVRTLRAHARNGYTFATPDAPEAYFLTGLRNPTPTMYERFDESAGDTDRILALLQARRVTAVAISSWRITSKLPDARLLAALRERYPDSAVVWHFTVRWAPEARRE